MWELEKFLRQLEKTPEWETKKNGTLRELLDDSVAMLSTTCGAIHEIPTIRSAGGIQHQIDLGKTIENFKFETDFKGHQVIVTNIHLQPIGSPAAPRFVFSTQGNALTDFKTKDDAFTSDDRAVALAVDIDASIVASAAVNISNAKLTVDSDMNTIFSSLIKTEHKDLLPKEDLVFDPSDLLISLKPQQATLSQLVQHANKSNVKDILLPASLFKSGIPKVVPTGAALTILKVVCSVRDLCTLSAILHHAG